MRSANRVGNSLVYCLALLVLPCRQLSAYVIRLPNPEASPIITATLNEPRGTANPGTRFHSGVDVDPFDNGNLVYAIESGIVYVEGSGQDVGVRVGGLFVYVHVEMLADLVSGESFVDAGDPIGRIIDYGAAGAPDDHLHLTELAGIKKRLNPLRPGQLEYSDVLPPDFLDVTGIGTNERISVVKDKDDKPLPKTADGVSIVPDFVDVLVSVGDYPLRMGIYALDFSVTNMAGTLVLDAPGNVTFDEKIADVFIGTSFTDNTVYLRKNTSSFVMWATNRVVTGTADVEAAVVDDRWDTRDHPEGDYFVRVRARDRKDNYRLIVGQVLIDRTKPELTIKDAPGAIILNGGITNSPTIKAFASDPIPPGSRPSGIDRVVLTQTSGGAFSSTASYNGEQSINTIFTGPEGNPLPEGGYVVVAYDLAGHDTQVSLTVDRSTPREIVFAITPSARVGNLFVTSSKRPRISAVFEDDQSGMDTNYFRIGLGKAGEELQPIANPEIGLGSLGLTFSPSFDLDDGDWTVGYVLQDLAGNVIDPLPTD